MNPPERFGSRAVPEESDRGEVNSLRALGIVASQGFFWLS